MNASRCDCCGQFGEMEEVTITIKKHKACDINSVFGQPVKPFSSIQTPSIPTFSIPTFQATATSESREDKIKRILAETPPIIPETNVTIGQ